MESMGGHHEREENGSGRRSKSLLAIPVGIKQKAVVDKLVSKVPVPLPGPSVVQFMHSCQI
jgi:hypothetical protein